MNSGGFGGIILRGVRYEAQNASSDDELWIAGAVDMVGADRGGDVPVRSVGPLMRS